MEINKKGQLIYPEQPIVQPPSEIDYEELISKPSFIARTSTSVDLSGAAATLICFHTELAAEIDRAFLIYTEASSADAGVAIKVGTETDDDYYYAGDSEASKAIWYVKNLTLLKKDIPAGDTVILTSAGGKTGTGEIMLVIEYKTKGHYYGG